MPKYKKTTEVKAGTWVVFPGYNDYPVQLLKDGCYGFFSPSWPSRTFTQCEYDREIPDLVYALHDPRRFSHLGEGWSELSKVSLATPKDFDIEIHDVEQSIATYKIQLSAGRLVLMTLKSQRNSLRRKTK